MSAKSTMAQNSQGSRIPGDDCVVDEELRDWIIAETKITEAEQARDNIRATTSQAQTENKAHSSGDNQTWVCTPALPPPSTVDSPYGRPSTSNYPLLERNKSVRRNLPMEFPGKHRELDLVPGSVFLVDSKGAFLKLPIPSGMPEDPLRWGYWKKTGAIASLLFFSMLSISSGQLPEINYLLLLNDPKMQVSGHIAELFLSFQRP